MKKIGILLLAIVAFTTMSFSAWFYCHPNGDLAPCRHYDAWGNQIHIGDLYPCTHYDVFGNPIHVGDTRPCVHICL